MLLALLIFFPMLAAPALYALGRRRERALDGAAVACAGAELALSAALLAQYLRCLPQSGVQAPYLEVPFVLDGAMRFRPDGFGVVYSALASLLWLGAALFSREYFRQEREHLASLWAFLFLTLGAVQGVFLSANYLCTFLFFELLSLSSFPWVMHERTPEAIRAGKTYLAVAVIGGLVLLMGLLLLADAAGGLKYDVLPRTVGAVAPGRLRAAGVCILLGFGAKAGMFPLHVWLPKAHPVAPAPASALLSGMLTKVGIFGVLMTVRCVLPSDGVFGALLLCLGLITMVLGAVLALCSVNLKRTLACSSMSQIGFILVGAAAMVLNRALGASEGLRLAWSGTVLHMVNHSVLKLLLFLSAGAVAMNLHALDLNEIRGWGRNKPLLKLCFGLGVLGIGGVPGFNGYLSKTLLHEGLVYAAECAGALALPLRGAEWLFLLSGGLTFAYMSKLYLCLFHEKNTDPARQARYDAKQRCMTPCSAAVLLAGAALLPVLGNGAAALRLAALMTGEAPGHFSAFAWENLRGGLISLGLGVAVYLCFVRLPKRREDRYRNALPAELDLEDRVYRPLLLRWLPAAFGRAAAWFGENRLLRPLCRGLVLAASVLGRLLDSSMDALVLALRRTLLREERVRDGRNLARRSRLRAFRHATGVALAHVLDNFSFALMMTCVGIILIFLLLVILM